MKIQIIVGSVRENRVAIHVAEWMQNALHNIDAEVEIVDLKTWNLPMYSGAPPMSLKGNYSDPLQKKWSEKITEGDAYFLISPEYNNGYSPALKNALDYLGVEWSGKPVGFVSYGSVNGARSIAQIRQVTTALGMIDSNISLLIRDIFARTKSNPFEGNETEHNVLNDLAKQLIALSQKLSQ